ncbi:hypothetical protein BCR37DRAFT_407987 [Protomyces lactucae-debilis]|uniref:Uncharacterized protein n=1 Tax=Protomyces lactucae-debilis TaxID=2754530 RepID=A0A1Y2FNZ9_PROLT|nr:uncharacterized protein BCR37DRAFT_407987 [Protomyces lactucae-debilis]ORY85054.1 hypothetical protein BCR37DRAFT_407987 [Protomyces lactucae-debilis]
MHFRDSSSLMTFTFTLLSLLFLVMHLELQHAAAEPGRSKGQNSIPEEVGVVVLQSKKRGRGEEQSAIVGGSGSATISANILIAEEGVDYFPRAEKGMCYNATFFIKHVHSLCGDQASCEVDKPKRQSYITDACDTWCSTEQAHYIRLQSEFNSKRVSKDRCFQSLSIHIARETKASDLLQSCDFECTCTLSKYVERIKMPHVQYNNKHFELSSFIPKSYWSEVPALSGVPPNRKGRPGFCHYEDMFEKVGYTSDITDPKTRTLSTAKWQVECKPGQCEKGHKIPKVPKKSSSQAKKHRLDSVGSEQPTEQCLAHSTHEVTNADSPARADATTSSQAALAGISAKPATADMRLNPNDWEEWIATMLNVEQNPTTGLPVDRNVLTTESCINHGLFNHPGFEQPHADICVAPSQDVQRQGVSEQGIDGIQDDDIAGYADNFWAEPPTFI